MIQMEQQTRSIQELFDDLPLSIRHLATQLEINEVTLARIRDGKPTRRSTANKLLMYFSDLYHERYTLQNVTGITIAITANKKTRE